MDLQEIIKNARQTVACVAGVEVTYHDGSNWVRLTAVPGNTDFLLDDGDGVVTAYKSRDWLINPDDLTFDGNTTIKPERGHLIKQTVGNKVYTYEVLRPDGMEQVWRYTDQYQSGMRIHSKLKSEANA